jgi:hypothetical protein
MSLEDYARRWKNLVKIGCDEAASGLLHDVFRFWRYAKAGWPPAEEEHREIAQKARTYRMAEIRKAAMRILDAEDDSEVNDWYELFCHNPAAFRARARQYARELTYIHDSGIWLDRDREGGVALTTSPPRSR